MSSGKSKIAFNCRQEEHGREGRSVGGRNHTSRPFRDNAPRMASGPLFAAAAPLRSGGAGYAEGRDSRCELACVSLRPAVTFRRQSMAGLRSTHPFNVSFNFHLLSRGGLVLPRFQTRASMMADASSSEPGRITSEVPSASGGHSLRCRQTARYGCGREPQRWRTGFDIGQSSWKRDGGCRKG